MEQKSLEKISAEQAGIMFSELMHYYKDFDWIISLSDEEFIEAYNKIKNNSAEQRRIGEKK